MPSDVTQLLEAIESGDPQAADELLPLVYDELRKLAAARLAHEPAGQTLQPTALVHEAWLRLAGSHQPWSGRGHFFGAAAEAMRRILIDRARLAAVRTGPRSLAWVGSRRKTRSGVSRLGPGRRHWGKQIVGP